MTTPSTEQPFGGDRWSSYITAVKLAKASMWADGSTKYADRSCAVSVIEDVADANPAALTRLLLADSHDKAELLKPLFELLNHLIPEGLDQTVAIRDPEDHSSVLGYFTPFSVHARQVVLGDERVSSPLSEQDVTVLVEGAERLRTMFEEEESQGEE